MAGSPKPAQGRLDRGSHLRREGAGVGRRDVVAGTVHGNVADDDRAPVGGADPRRQVEEGDMPFPAEDDERVSN